MPKPELNKSEIAIKSAPEKTGAMHDLSFSEGKIKRGAKAENNNVESLHVSNKICSFERRKENQGSLNENKQLSLEKCRKILEESGNKYTDEEVLKIRKLLYKLGNLEYHLFIELKKTKQYDQCNPLRTGIH